jgi:hypothetical protein
MYTKGPAKIVNWRITMNKSTWLTQNENMQFTQKMLEKEETMIQEQMLQIDNK